VVIDPRQTPLALQADLHLAIKPGTDLEVALAVHRYLATEGHVDHEFVRQHTTGFEQLVERAMPWSFEKAA
jgi:anaerobic selenocysteine-containing dehydrogenase